jgi:3-oxoacyl-[acyl-carrier protein] reductase
MTKSLAIVTGASSGIGYATALRLARDFEAVVLVARNREGLERVANAVRAVGSEPMVVDIDSSLPAAAKAIVDRTLDKHGRIDALLNIAGAVPGIDLFEMTDVQWNVGAELKLHGARRLTIGAWEALKSSKGSVVLMSGVTAQVPTASAAAVGVINAAISALAKAFADRGGVDGIQVNSVLPGLVMTDRRVAMIKKAASVSGMTVDEAKQKLLAQAGLVRYGQPEEIAELMAFLVSPTMRWMTGAALRIDGGEVKIV